MSIPTVEHNLEDKPGLWLLHEPRPPLRAVCDIIAVHGLSGGPSSTWKHPQTQSFWLRHFLPNELEDLNGRTSVRIWTYGYNANVVFSPGDSGISEFTSNLLRHLEVNRVGQDGRKVVFVTHSLGGIVVKSALLDTALRGSEHAWLLDATVGVVFLGTPHQGSDIANKGAFLAKVAKYTGVVRPNGALLSTLEENSGALFEKAERFRGICGAINIASFHETRKMKLSMGISQMIVPPHSAMIGVAHEKFTSLEADHRSICKFASPTDQNFNLVKAAIKKMVYPSDSNISFLGGSPSVSGSFYSNGSTQRENFGGYQANDRRTRIPNVTDERKGYWIPQPNQPPSSGSPYPENSFSEMRYRYDDQPSNASQPSFYTQPEDRFEGWNVPPNRGVSSTPEQGRSPMLTHTRAASNGNSQLPSRSQFTQHRYSESGTYPVPTPDAAKTSPIPQQSGQDRFLGASSVPSLYHSTSSYSMNSAQLSETNKKTSPTPARTPVASPPEPELQQHTCDICTKEIAITQRRFHCTVCYDYDICLSCHERKATSYGHLTSHKTMSFSITSRQNVHFDEIVASQNTATPQRSPPRTLNNWEMDGSGRRWVHLRKSPSHARFISPPVLKGQYLMQFTIKFKFSAHVSEQNFNDLKGKGALGRLTIATGSPIDTSNFRSEPKVSDNTLAQQLFGSVGVNHFDLSIPDHVVDPQEGWAQRFDGSASPTHIGVNSNANTKSADVGILFQWSDVREFEDDSPLLTMALNEIVMDKLVVYDQSPPQAVQTPEPSPQPAAPANRNTETESASGDEGQPTMEELTYAQQYLQANNKALSVQNYAIVIASLRKQKTNAERMILIYRIQQAVAKQEREKQERERRAAQQAQAVGDLSDLLLLGMFLNSQN